MLDQKLQYGRLLICDLLQSERVIDDSKTLTKQCIQKRRDALSSQLEWDTLIPDDQLQQWNTKVDALQEQITEKEREIEVVVIEAPGRRSITFTTVANLARLTSV